ncbi:hypothetical protein PC116_g12761 [Phytophthora cactorum]|nr:hypothetical protein PC116_g12761 [Phytophthora cactorum]
MLASIVFGGIFNYHWTRDHARIHKLYGAAFYVLSGYTLYYSLGTSGATNQSSEAVENTLGGTDLALYASPLETIKNVFETKDASTIPITISAFFLANGIVWEVHSIAEDDMLVRDRSRVVCRPSSAVRGVLSSQDSSLPIRTVGCNSTSFTSCETMRTF